MKTTHYSCSVCLVPLTQDNEVGICQRNLRCTVAYKAAYRQIHKAEISIYESIYREAHKEHKAARMAAWEESNKEKRAAYKEEHKEERAAYRAAWKKANPEKVRADKHQRRVWVKVRMTKEDRALSIDYRKAISHDMCFYCKVAPGAHDDHYVSLVNGGTNHWWNLVRACAHCNFSKGSQNGDEFLSLKVPG